MTMLPELPVECWRLILERTCKHRMRAMLVECRSVATFGTQAWPFAEHTAICGRRSTWVLETRQVATFARVVYRDDLHCDVMQPPLELCVAAPLDADYWWEARERDGITDARLRPCFPWGTKVSLHVSLLLTRSIGGRYTQDAIEVCNRTIYVPRHDATPWSIEVLHELNRDPACHYLNMDSIVCWV